MEYVLVLETRFCEFESHYGYCGYGLKVKTSDCGSENEGSIPSSHPFKFAPMVELEYTLDLKSSAFIGLRVRISLGALCWCDGNGIHVCFKHKILQVRILSPVLMVVIV